jgi:hypothetical protein
MKTSKAQYRRKQTVARWLSMYEGKAGSDLWPIYSTSALHPGKLVKRLPNGKEVIGTFQNGTFVPE